MTGVLIKREKRSTRGGGGTGGSDAAAAGSQEEGGKSVCSLRKHGLADTLKLDSEASITVTECISLVLSHVVRGTLPRESWKLPLLLYPCFGPPPGRHQPLSGCPAPRLVTILYTRGQNDPSKIAAHPEVGPLPQPCSCYFVLL